MSHNTVFSYLLFLDKRHTIFVNVRPAALLGTAEKRASSKQSYFKNHIYKQLDIQFASDNTNLMTSENGALIYTNVVLFVSIWCTYPLNNFYIQFSIIFVF